MTSENLLQALPPWIRLREHAQHEILQQAARRKCARMDAIAEAHSGQEHLSRAHSRLTSRLCSGFANLRSTLAEGTFSNTHAYTPGHADCCWFSGGGFTALPRAVFTCRHATCQNVRRATEAMATLGKAAQPSNMVLGTTGTHRQLHHNMISIQASTLTISANVDHGYFACRNYIFPPAQLMQAFVLDRLPFGFPRPPSFAEFDPCPQQSWHGCDARDNV